MYSKFFGLLVFNYLAFRIWPKGPTSILGFSQWPKKSQRDLQNSQDLARLKPNMLLEGTKVGVDHVDTYFGGNSDLNLKLYYILSKS